MVTVRSASTVTVPATGLATVPISVKSPMMAWPTPVTVSDTTAAPRPATPETENAPPARHWSIRAVEATVTVRETPIGGTPVPVEASTDPLAQVGGAPIAATPRLAAVRH